MFAASFWVHGEIAVESLHEGGGIWRRSGKRTPAPVATIGFCYLDACMETSFDGFGSSLLGGRGHCAV
jgi:hypothetical protein